MNKNQRSHQQIVEEENMALRKADTIDIEADHSKHINAHNLKTIPINAPKVIHRIGMKNRKREQQKELLQALVLDYREAHYEKKPYKLNSILRMARRWEREGMIKLEDFKGCVLCDGKNVGRGETVFIMYVCDHCRGRKVWV